MTQEDARGAPNGLPISLRDVLPAGHGRLRWDVAIASGLIVLHGPAEGRARIVGILARQFS